jgi:hypothetical protein
MEKCLNHGGKRNAVRAAGRLTWTHTVRPPRL